MAEARSSVVQSEGVQPTDLTECLGPLVVHVRDRDTFQSWIREHVQWHTAPTR